MVDRASVRDVSFLYAIEVNSIFRLLPVEGVPVEEQRLSRVLLRIVPAVNSGIQTCGVRILRFRQKVVEYLLACVKTVFVVRAAVEVDLDVLQSCGVLGEFERV